jgi:Na+/H+ antiporter NhaD/arsenite permease-like protein
VTMASWYTICFGSLIFTATWIFMAFKVKIIPIGRTLGTLAGAVLIVVFQILSPSEAFAAISLETLALLLGTMIITILLERENFFKHLIKLLTYRCTTAYSLLARLCLLSGILSALVTNDTACVFFTPMVVQLCERFDLPHGVFLIALATSANIGSSFTPVGNPQNMLIATYSHLSYAQFIKFIAIPAILCLILNTLLLMAYYRKNLSGKSIKVSNTLFIRCSEAEMEQLLKEEEENNSLQQSKFHQQKNDNAELIISSAENRRISADTHTATHPDYLPNSVTAHFGQKDFFQSARRTSHPNNSALISSELSNEHTKLGEEEKIEGEETKSPSIAAIHRIAEQLSIAETLSSDTNLSPEEIIHSLQLKFYRNNYSVPNCGQSNSEDHLLERREGQRERIASHDHPRISGRRLIMQAPVISPAFLAPLSAKNLSWGSLRAHTLRSKLFLFVSALLGTLAAFVGGANLGWAALCGATVMLLIDLAEPDGVLREVDWALLVFFSSLFIVVAGFHQTQLPDQAWSAVKSSINIDHYDGVLLYSLVILIGSNTVSNVPLVLLLANSIPNLNNPTAAWLILAFVSTVAGNLTLVGSVANLIVCARAKHSYNLTFWEYCRFGFPTTVLISWVGVSAMFALLT